MKNEEYNGWSNYATWRVNLECVDSVHYEEAETVYNSISELADAIKNNVELFIGDEASGSTGSGICYDYAMAFLSDVNWYEIAKNMAENLPQLVKEEEQTK